MDRDNNWDRIEQAYNAIAEGDGLKSNNPSDAIQSSYKSGDTDEFILPHVIAGYTGINDGDGILMFNFRFCRASKFDV